MASKKNENKLWREYLAWRRRGEDPAPLSIGQRVKYALTGTGARLFLRMMTDTCGWRAEGYPLVRNFGRQQCILVSWHNRVLGVISLLERHQRRNPAYVPKGIVSASADGELLARMVRENGGGVFRGSSSRDGAKALRGSVEAARAGHDILTVGDGPRGPRYKLKPGAVLMAKATGLPIVPVSWSSTRTLQLHRAWDQLMIPLPGSTLTIRCGEPVQVPEDADARAIARKRRELEQRLDELTEWADAATRITWQMPRPRPGEALKRRPLIELEGRHYEGD